MISADSEWIKQQIARIDADMSRSPPIQRAWPMWLIAGFGMCAGAAIFAAGSGFFMTLACR